MHVYQKSQSYDVRFLRYGVKRTEFFVILGYFLPFYHPPPNNPTNQNFEKSTCRCHHFTQVYQKSGSYHVCFLRYGVWQTEFFIILDFFFFLPFYPSNNPENKNFGKIKKTPGNIIIYHKWQSYDVWLMRYGARQTLWVIFCPFTPLKTWNIKILKKWKKCLEISSFYTSAPKITIICYTVPKIWRMMDVIFIFHFGHFLPFYTP